MGVGGQCWMPFKILGLWLSVSHMPCVLFAPQHLPVRIHWGAFPHWPQPEIHTVGPPFLLPQGSVPGVWLGMLLGAGHQAAPPCSPQDGELTPVMGGSCMDTKWFRTMCINSLSWSCHLLSSAMAWFTSFKQQLDI